MQILDLHVIPGTFKSGDLTDGGEVTTIDGMTLTANVAGGSVTFTAPEMGLSLIHI